MPHPFHPHVGRGGPRSAGAGRSGRAALTVALAVVGGCAPRARPTPEPEMVGGSAGYTCAYRRLRDSGYTLSRTTPESGTVAGQRIVSPPLAARTEWDEIVVTAPVGATARGPVHARARGGVEEAGRRRVAAPTARARRDAARLVEACRDAGRAGRATSGEGSGG